MQRAVCQHVTGVGSPTFRKDLLDIPSPEYFFRRPHQEQNEDGQQIVDRVIIKQMDTLQINLQEPESSQPGTDCHMASDAQHSCQHRPDQNILLIDIQVKVHSGWNVPQDRDSTDEMESIHQKLTNGRVQGENRINQQTAITAMENIVPSEM